MTPRFDPTRAVVYDLARGQLRDDEGAPRLNLPFHLVSRLLEHAGDDATSDFSQSLGHEIGRRVKDRMGQEAESASLVSWAEHLGGQVALLGLGNLQVERWGKALVLRVTGYPEGGMDLVGQVLEGALHRGTSRRVKIVPFLAQESVGYLVVSATTAAKAQQLAGQGQGLGQVVEALHQGAA